MKSHSAINRIYRLVWSAALGVWLAVAENVKGCGKGGSARSRVAVCSQTATAGFTLHAICRGALALVGAVAFVGTPALAGPVGGVVAVGAGSISQSAGATTINQASQRLAIDWSSFSTAAGESVVFNQPNAQAIVLNRITGSSPSTMLGSLSANGQVFILNPNGVLFGAGAQVNVGGLVASTLSMSNADFVAGNHVFTSAADSRGRVTNQGTLTAARGGYIALLAPEVRNEGVVSATRGTALLAAGNKVTLYLNNGSLLGYSIDQGAFNALAENRQLIEANGGQVLMSARAADAVSSAMVNNTGVIEARTLQNQGGRILLVGDMTTGQVNISGTLDASAPQGGNGGFIETSAARVTVANGAVVTTAAPQGNAGNWLIDPTDYTIAATGGDINGTTLAANLGSGNVTIQTAAAGAGNGDIFVNEAVTWNAATQLTLNAQRNIAINQAITAQNAAGRLALEYGQAAVAAGNTATYNVSAAVNLQAGNNFSTRLGSDGATLGYQVITALGAQGSNTNADLQGLNGAVGSRYVLGADIDASATSGWNGGLGFAPLFFDGTLDGLGHTVTGLTVNRPAENNVGLFGTVGATAAIRNLRVAGGSITGIENVGGLAGQSAGSISNSASSAAVNGQASVGGLVGLNNGSVTTSSASGAVTADSADDNYKGVGGLVGASFGAISGSFATGTVTGPRDAGGLVGRNDFGGSIGTSSASGNVSGSGLGGIFSAGGLVGYSPGLVRESYASGNVSGNVYVGGFGGFVPGSVTNAYATGAVSGDSRIGGLIGSSGGVVSNTYATGAVSGDTIVGGLMGESSGSIRTSYATGSVAGTATVGGLVGSNTGAIGNSYWNTATSGQTTGVGTGNTTGATCRTTAQMTQLASFAGFSISATGGTRNVWRIYEGISNPLLRGFMAGLVLADTTVTYNSATQTGAAVAPTVTPTGTRTGTSASGRNVGTYTSASNQQGYDISGGRLTIDQAALTISSTNVSRVYDGTLAAAGTAMAAGGTSSFGDTLTGGNFSFIDRNAGTGRVVTVSGVTVNDGNNGANYAVTYADNTASTITRRALVVNAAGVDRIYDGTTTATVSLLDNRVAGDALALSNASANFADRNAGTGKVVNVAGINVTGSDAGNYSFNTTASTTASIAPRALTVTANNDTRFFSGAPYTGGNGVAFSGFAPGDTAADVRGNPAYTGSSQGAVAPGRYTITPGGLSSASGNYALGYANGVLTVSLVNQGNAALGNAALTGAYASALLSVADTELPDDAQRSVAGGKPVVELVDCGVRLPATLNTRPCE